MSERERRDNGSEAPPFDTNLRLLTQQRYVTVLLTVGYKERLLYENVVRVFPPDHHEHQDIRASAWLLLRLIVFKFKLTRPII